MQRYAPFLIALLLSGAAYAHGPTKGAHGGQQVDAGDYHVEMVAKDTSLAVFINDKDEKPVDAQYFKGIGLFVVSGKSQRIELKAESQNKLSGSSAIPLPPNLKGVVQITLPDGKTVQAKFE